MGAPIFFSPLFVQRFPTESWAPLARSLSLEPIDLRDLTSLAGWPSNCPLLFTAGFRSNVPERTDLDAWATAVHQAESALALPCPFRIASWRSIPAPRVFYPAHDDPPPSGFLPLITPRRCMPCSRLRQRALIARRDYALARPIREGSRLPASLGRHPPKFRALSFLPLALISAIR